MNLILMYITVKNKHEALQLAQTLLAEKHIACANILPNVTSVYEWEGKMQQEEEVVMIAKTTDQAKARTMARIAELHSYECPCIVALNAEDVHSPFNKWVFSQVRD